jgi:hypothetical protein
MEGQMPETDKKATFTVSGPKSLVAMALTAMAGGVAGAGGTKLVAADMASLTAEASAAETIKKLDVPDRTEVRAIVSTHTADMSEKLTASQEAHKAWLQERFRRQEDRDTFTAAELSRINSMLQSMDGHLRTLRRR